MGNNDFMLPPKQQHEAPWVKTSGNWSYWYEYITMNYILKSDTAPSAPNAATPLRCPSETPAKTHYNSVEIYVSYGLNGALGASATGAAALMKAGGKVAYRESIARILHEGSRV